MLKEWHHGMEPKSERIHKIVVHADTRRIDLEENASFARQRVAQKVRAVLDPEYTGWGDEQYANLTGQGLTVLENGSRQDNSRRLLGPQPIGFSTVRDIEPNTGSVSSIPISSATRMFYMEIERLKRGSR